LSIWTLIQVVFDLALTVGFLTLWLRSRRPPQDDPRMSRGLQLLQTKITVLEDLSDRTEAQVKQLTGLLDHKTRVLQNKMLEAEQQMVKIDHSMNKSLEVAEIFQDKIPHQEILERQRTVEYVKAARMAHSGMSVEEIAQSVILPREQLELIAKFNREQLMFDENQLPEWASQPAAIATDDSNQGFALKQMDFVNNLDSKPTHDPLPMNRIEIEFRAAVQNSANALAQSQQSTVQSFTNSMNANPTLNVLRDKAQGFRDKLVATAEELLGPNVPVAPTQHPVRKVIFPRIEK
jgi:hypothetical protein